MSWRSRIEHLSKNTHVRYGIPFIVFIVAGSFGLRDFQQSARYDYRRVGYVSTEEFEKTTGTKIGEVNIDELLKETQKVAEEEYNMVRGPRPWEKETIEQNAEIKRQKRLEAVDKIIS